MSERLGSPARLTITHEEAIASPELRDRYRDERVAAIKAGEPVWKLRGFDTDSDMDRGIVLDYYQDGQKMGFIEGNDLDGYHVYGPETEEGEGPQHLNTEPKTLLSEAQKSLTDYLDDTRQTPLAQ